MSAEVGLGRMMQSKSNSEFDHYSEIFASPGQMPAAHSHENDDTKDFKLVWQKTSNVDSSKQYVILFPLFHWSLTSVRLAHFVREHDIGICRTKRTDTIQSMEPKYQNKQNHKQKYPIQHLQTNLFITIVLISQINDKIKTPYRI